MNDNLLVHLTNTIGSRRAEDVASASLTYLLGRDEQLRHRFLQTVEGAGGHHVEGPMQFRSQAVVGGAGRTDISGYADGKEVLIVEAKIAAGLGLGQALAYTTRLSEGGTLVLLAPEKRLSVLFADACRQCSACRDGDARRADAGSVRLVGLTWEQVLSGFKELPLDETLKAQLAEVRGLYTHLEATSYIPLSSDDLSRSVARTSHSIGRIATEVIHSLRAGALPAAGFERARLDGGEEYYGAWGKLNGFNCWFGSHTHHWLHEAETPFWVYLQGVTAATGEAICTALATEDQPGPGRARYRPEDDMVIIPIWPALGTDLHDTVVNMVDQIRTLSGQLDQAGIRGQGGTAEPALPSEEQAADG